MKSHRWWFTDPTYCRTLWSLWNQFPIVRLIQTLRKWKEKLNHLQASIGFFSSSMFVHLGPPEKRWPWIIWIALAICLFFLRWYLGNQEADQGLSFRGSFFSLLAGAVFNTWRPRWEALVVSFWELCTWAQQNWRCQDGEFFFKAFSCYASWRGVSSGSPQQIISVNKWSKYIKIIYLLKSFQTTTPTQNSSGFLFTYCIFWACFSWIDVPKSVKGGWCCRLLPDLGIFGPYHPADAQKPGKPSCLETPFPCCLLAGSWMVCVGTNKCLLKWTWSKWVLGTSPFFPAKNNNQLCRGCSFFSLSWNPRMHLTVKWKREYIGCTRVESELICPHLGENSWDTDTS